MQVFYYEVGGQLTQNNLIEEELNELSLIQDILKWLVVVGLVLGFILGLLLFLDEITMIFPFLVEFGIHDRFLGDLSAYHIERFHHWQFGVVLMLLCAGGLFVYFKKA